MTDLVVGGGAVGSLVAWALATGGREVAVVRRARSEAAGPADITVSDPEGVRRTAPVTEVQRPADLGVAPELLVFAVKLFDLRAAVRSCAAWPATPSLTIGNGIGAEELVAEERPGSGIIAGSVTVAVERRADGAVGRLNRGGIALAPWVGEVGELSERLAKALARSGLRARRLSDARAMKWSKLLANLVGNASSAIVDRSPAEIYADRGAFRVERQQLLEALAVMRSQGLAPVALPGADVRLLALAVRAPSVVSRPALRRVVEAARGGKDPSLRLHVRAGGGPSEVPWLNGAVARAADRQGLAAPVNRRLADLVEEILRDPARREWFRGRLDRFVDAVGLAG